MAWRGFFLLLLVHCPSSGHWASPLDFHVSCLYFNSSVIIMCMVWTFSWVWLVTRRMNYYAQVTHFDPLRILGGDRGKTHHYITVHLFVPIQWTFQQVRFIGCPHVSPPHSSGGLMEVENFLLHFVSVRPQSKRAQTDLESQSSLNSDQTVLTCEVTGVICFTSTGSAAPVTGGRVMICSK